jgi:IS4 transposase
VVESVPEAVAQKRLKKLAEYAQKHKDKQVSEQRKAMCYYNMFITNIAKEKLAPEQIRAVYSLRWQIEIMFKLWKSHYNIDKVKKMSIFRFECHIYATAHSSPFGFWLAASYGAYLSKRTWARA